MKRWIVREGDGATVAEIAARAGEEPSAIDEGRVFIGRRRAMSREDRVRPGDEVTIAPPPDTAPPAVVVLLHKGDIVVVDKPAGIPTIPDHGGAAYALVTLVAANLALAVSRLHPTSRLDRDVSGAVTFALSPAAAERLASARARGLYERRYVAIATRAPVPAAGEWTAAIGRASDPRHRRVSGANAAPALTRYSAVAAAGVASMLALSPVTGRTHQLRVHAAHADAPLLGDRVYGDRATRGGRITLASGKIVPLDRIALHCAFVAFPGADGKLARADAPIPKELEDLWLSLGGDAAAWDIAVSCSPGASRQP